MQLNTYFKNYLIAMPLVVLTIVPFMAMAQDFGIDLAPKYILLGALGWWLALIARLPAILLAKRMTESKGRLLVILASGPAEEVVRLVILVTIGLTTGNAYSVGLGWAAIELVYTLVQGAAMGVLGQKHDAKAKAAKAMMKKMGMDKALQPEAPFWGVLERLSANALHLGFSLLLVISPYFAILTAPLHSAINLALTKLIRRSILEAELAVFAAAVFLLGVALAYLP